MTRPTLPLILAAVLLSACHTAPASARVPASAKPQAPQARAASSKATTIQQSTVTEAAKFVASTPGVQFIDVRTPAEYAEGHAVGAVNLPLDQLPTWAPTLKGDQPVVVICRSGSRSGKACSMLQAGTFKSLTNVEGGTLAWEAQGLPMAK